MALNETYNFRDDIHKELLAKAKIKEQEKNEIKKSIDNEQLSNQLFQIIRQTGMNENGKLSKTMLERCWKGTVADCINLKAKYCSKAIPVMYKKTSQTKNEPMSRVHSFIKLLENPNDGYGTTGKTLITKSIQNYSIYGDSFWYVQPGNMGLPNALIHLPTKYVETKYKNGIPTHYEYTDTNGTVIYKLDDVLHIQNPNPFHPYEGISDIQLAYKDILIQLELSNYQLNYLTNGAVPPVVLETDKDLKSHQIKNLLDNWNQISQGTNQAGNIELLTNGLKAKILGTSNRDLDYIESAKFFDNKIMNHFGVHIGLVNAENVNKANVFGAIVIFNHIIINELLDNFSSALTLFIQKKYADDSIFLKFELEMPNDPEQKRADYKLQSEIANSIGNKYIQKVVLDDFRNYTNDSKIDDTLLELNTDNTNIDINTPDSTIQPNE